MDRKLVFTLAGMSLGIQLVANFTGGYGYFIDELYYLACAKRLALGYVDHPPLSLWLLRLATEALGASIPAIRLLPAVFGAATVAATGWLAFRLGGSRFAQGLAALCTMAVPVFLVFFDFYSMNSLEVLLWTACLAVAVTMVERDEPKLWVLFGAIAGIGLLNKHTMVLLGASIVVGLLLTPARRLLFSPWILVGGVIAFVIFSPNLWWQAAHDFPSLEFYRNATILKNLPSSPSKILFDQWLFMNPTTSLVWVAGIAYLMFSQQGRRFRFVGIAYVLLLGMLVLSQSSRPDRIAGMYPLLFAAGAVSWEKLLQATALRTALAAVILVGAVALAPICLPLLPPAQTAQYLGTLGLDLQFERGEGKRANLPQWLADRFGWEAFVKDVEDVYRSLTPDERAGATIFVPSYGHAGALELLGTDLPPVVSPHNTYYLWGKEHTARWSRGIAISIGSDLRGVYGDVREVRRHTCDYCMGWRNDMPIYVGREPLLTADEAAAAWERAKHFE